MATPSRPAAVHVNGVPVEVPDGARRRGSGPRVVARLAGPVLAHWAPALHRAGAEVAFWCPPRGACLTVQRDTVADAVARLPFVVGFVPYDERLCQRRLAPPPDGPGRAWLDVVCFSHAVRPLVVARLRTLGATVLDQGRSKVRIEWPGDPAPVRDLVGVKLVERPRLPRAATAGLAPDLGWAEAGTWRDDLDGEGEVVAVCDTGFDTGDPRTAVPDLRGRLRHLRSWPLGPSWTPYVTNPGADDGPADVASGHGTFVTGVLAGDGAQSGGRNRGVAPGAEVVVEAIEQFVDVAPGHPEVGPSRHVLAGRPTDLRELFDDGRRRGARIQVAAWGTPAAGAYDNDAFEADLFLREHPESVLLVAAGNGGSDRGGDRVADPGSVESPASAKNVLTVGATEGSAPNGFPGTWDRLQTEGRRFADARDRSDATSGQPDRMAPLSASGPTQDGRRKPDLCAPGTNLVGPRSTVATGRGWGLASPAPHYVVDGGTSAAVAAAAGAVALVRQGWRRHRGGHAPSGPALKALLVVGAAPVRSRDGSRPEDPRWCGHGRVDVDGSLPAPADGSRVRILENATASRALRTGGTRSFRVPVPDGGRLRAVLCWYDLPGERLVCDLDLSLTGPLPASPPVHGNHEPGRPDRPGVPDRVNTVEVVDVGGLAGGTWVLAVHGANIPQGPQPYALVVRTWPAG
ncbi:S8 family serine peptidase [Arthrobacter sp. NEB 688]|uniref:S8 family serine peptidase n=1 Tax=Arthrobacter sp. NEB 688 TaxID=904039 RepID=UPI001565C954|nr:S8 family serine peptidase [Arthrobacter sp. NEB 688]QKE85046.1 S8 family serine peptidase [Arthrobacter sp. NEB 688]